MASTGMSFRSQGCSAKSDKEHAERGVKDRNERMEASSSYRDTSTSGGHDFGGTECTMDSRDDIVARDVFAKFDAKKTGKVRVCDIQDFLEALGRPPDVATGVALKVEMAEHAKQDVSRSPKKGSSVYIANLFRVMQSVEAEDSLSDLTALTRSRSTQSSVDPGRKKTMAIWGVHPSKVEGVSVLLGLPMKKMHPMGMPKPKTLGTSSSTSSVTLPSVDTSDFPIRRTLSVSDLKNCFPKFVNSNMRKKPPCLVDETQYGEPLMDSVDSSARRTFPVRKRRRHRPLCAQKHESLSPARKAEQLLTPKTARTSAMESTGGSSTFQELCQDDNQPLDEPADTDKCSETGDVRQDEVSGKKAGHREGAHGQQAKKQVKNPFVEFEDKEMRLQDERRWLQDDDTVPNYFDYRLREKKQSTANLHLEIDAGDPFQQYEDAVYHGAYSVQVKANVAYKQELKRLQLLEKEGSRTPESMSGARKALKKPKKSEEKPEEKPKKSERNASAACVKSLRSMHEDLGSSTAHWNAVEKAKEAEAKKKEAKEANAKGFDFGGAGMNFGGGGTDIGFSKSRQSSP